MVRLPIARLKVTVNFWWEHAVLALNNLDDIFARPPRSISAYMIQSVKV